MVNHKISESVKELLKNSSFLLWCLTPTEELNKQWKDWIDKHPDRSEDFEKAKQLIQSTKWNEFKLPIDESKALYARISTNLNRRKRQKKIWLVLGTAACIAALCLTTVWIAYQGNPRMVSDGSLANISASIDSAQTEVELELSASKKVRIDNKATILLNSQGQVLITDDQDIASSAPTEEEEQKIVGSPMNILKVPNGRHSSLILADGTKVWVNSGTVLHFPSTFDTDNRTIIVNGEIYLEVAKDASRPFYVRTSRMNVRVLGTAFNVTAYEDEPFQTVVLARGSVEVSSTIGETRRIRPEEMLVLENEAMRISQVDVSDYISWKDGQLHFDRKTIGYVIQRLSHYYGVEFECTEDIRNYVCSGKLVLFDDLASVMKTLKNSFSLNYRIEGKKVILSSNPQKEEPMK